MCNRYFPLCALAILFPPHVVWSQRKEPKFNSAIKEQGVLKLQLYHLPSLRRGSLLLCVKTTGHTNQHTHSSAHAIYANTQRWAVCLANKITLVFITALALEAAISGRTSGRTHTHTHTLRYRSEQ